MRMDTRWLPAALALLLVTACGTPTPSLPPEENDDSPPGQPPADSFTTADGVRVGVQVLVTGLEVPWSLAFAPDGRLFVTERPGRVRIVENGRLQPGAALVLTGLFTRDESGVLGIAVDPAFATNRWVYLAFTAQEAGAPELRVVRYREVGGTLGEPAVLLDRVPAANIHNGSRLRFGPDGALYVTLGDVAVPSAAQDLGSLNGKILRLSRDGTTPPDNPFTSPVWSWGHRNPQGLDWHPESGLLYATEHGQVGNDEVNLVERGRNYGWPIIEGDGSRPDMERPIVFFTPAVAPSGASFYRGSTFPAFRNDLFIATLRGMALIRLRLDAANPRRVVSTERLLEGRYGRLRDVVSGPDGSLYVITSNRDGRTTPVGDDDRLLRLAPP